MLFPVAGCRFFIADTPSVMPTGGWVEIGETEAFGMLGGRYELEDGHVMGPEDYFAHKGVHRPTTMQILLGIDMTDPGQLLLFKAYNTRAPFPFRLLFPDGETERRWLALVMSFDEVFDAANNVMRMQAELHPVAAIQRVSHA
ncbi:MAG: hypothetical protein ACK4GT_20365 [Pararhodobacter sp.]